MGRRSVQILIIAAIALCSGCATLSKEECLAADWRTIGYEDGSRGYAASRIGEHRAACADYGIAPDLTGYQRGHREGAEVYCVPNTGFEEGRRGATYNGICSARMEEDFRAAYQHGREIYKLRSAVNQLVDEIQQAYRDIEYHQERADAARDMSRAAWQRKDYDQAEEHDRDADEHLKKIGRLEVHVREMEVRRSVMEVDAERLDAAYRPYYY